MIDLEEARRMLSAGRAIRDSLKTAIADIDDANHDVVHGNDHAATSLKLSKVLDDLDRVPDLPKRHTS